MALKSAPKNGTTTAKGGKGALKAGWGKAPTGAKKSSGYSGGKR